MEVGSELFLETKN